MTKELADIVGLVEGEKALHLAIGPYSSYLEVIVIKEVVSNRNCEVVVLADEYEGYLNPSTIYNKSKLLVLLEE